MYKGVELQIHAVLSFAVNGGEWSASCPSYITRGVSAPITYWIGGLMDARTGLDETPAGNHSFIGCKASSLVSVWAKLS